MVITNLPCLEYLGQQIILGRGKSSCSKSYAFTELYTGAFDLSAIMEKRISGSSKSTFASKYDSE